MASGQTTWQDGFLRECGIRRGIILHGNVVDVVSEPFLQAQGLAVVAEGVSHAGLSVMTFTGYTMNELDELSLPGARELLAWTDVLVDGPYESANPDRSRNWVGSTNQRFHYLTNRYDASIEGADVPNREVEWRIRDDGRFVVNGWPCAIK